MLLTQSFSKDEKLLIFSTKKLTFLPSVFTTWYFYWLFGDCISCIPITFNFHPSQVCFKILWLLEQKYCTGKKSPIYVGHTLTGTWSNTLLEKLNPSPPSSPRSTFLYFISGRISSIRLKRRGQRKHNVPFLNISTKDLGCSSWI